MTPEKERQNFHWTLARHRKKHPAIPADKSMKPVVETIIPLMFWEVPTDDVSYGSHPCQIPRGKDDPKSGTRRHVKIPGIKDIGDFPWHTMTGLTTDSFGDHPTVVNPGSQVPPGNGSLVTQSGASDLAEDGAGSSDLPRPKPLDCGSSTVLGVLGAAALATGYFLWPARDQPIE